MPPKDKNDEKISSVPSNITSAIGILKGRGANNNQPTTPVEAKDGIEHASAIKTAHLTVMPDSALETDLYPVSSDMPDSHARKKLLENAAQISDLTNALNASYASIDALEKDLATAKATIARLAIERTQGVEEIIDNLRKFQTEGANLGTIGLSQDSLTTIFSSNTKLTERAGKAAFYTKLEGDIRLALETLKAASGDAFSFNIDTAERPDFYKTECSNDSPKIDPNMPAKLILIDLKKSTNSAMQNDVRVVVINIKDKIFYLKEKECGDDKNKKDAFLSSTGKYDIGVFRTDGRRVEYEGRGNAVNMHGPYTAIPAFVDEIVSNCLSEAIDTTRFDQAARSLKTMGLIP